MRTACYWVFVNTSRWSEIPAHAIVVPVSTRCDDYAGNAVEITNCRKVGDQPTHRVGRIQDCHVIKSVVKNFSRLCAERICQARRKRNCCIRSRWEVHNKSCAIAPNDERTTKGMKNNALDPGIEPFHDNPRAGQGGVAAKRHFNCRREPT